jgi:hypothetical protein
LPGQRVSWVLLQEFWSKDIIELVAFREFETVQVSHFLNNLIGTLVLIAQLLARSFTCPVLG